MTGQDIVAHARTFIGTKWVHQGRSASGIDCAGLVVKVGNDLGLMNFEPPKDYERAASDESMLEFCRDQMQDVRFSSALPGDVPVMRFKAYRHIGFFGDYPHGGLSLIHAFSIDHLKVIEHRFSLDWLKSYEANLLGVFRFKGIQ